jgi:hypothetical protein
VIALGHPNGLAAPADYPPGARVYGMSRIKSVNKQPEEVRLPVQVNRSSWPYPQNATACGRLSPTTTPWRRQPVPPRERQQSRNSNLLGRTVCMVWHACMSLRDASGYPRQAERRPSHGAKGLRPDQTAESALSPTIVWLPLRPRRNGYDRILRNSRRQDSQDAPHSPRDDGTKRRALLDDEIEEGRNPGRTP